jgi:hypothetical protein
MKLLTKLIHLILLLPAAPPLLAGLGNDMNTWRKYRVVIPHFYFEYSIPSNLTSGYRPALKEIAFDYPEADQGVSRLGQGAWEKAIATYFHGVVGDFRDFDMTVEISVVKFDGAKTSMKSGVDLSEYVQKIFSRKLVLKNGKEVFDFGGVTTENIGQTEVVVAIAADLYHITEVTLQNGAVMFIQPYQIYFIRLDTEVTVCIRVLHHTQKRLNPKWHANANAMVAAIIEKMKFIPQR